MNDEFITWLVKRKSYSLRSARDLRSRLKRIDGVVKIPEKYGEDFIKELEKNQTFESYSVQIKSHTRRALRFLKEYRESPLS